jgi:hypothetical protein
MKKLAAKIHRLDAEDDMVGIMRTLNRLMEMQAWPTFEGLLRSLDPEELSPETLVGICRMLYPLSGSLRFWGRFMEKVRDVIKEYGDADQILTGLSTPPRPGSGPGQ